jgi:hypothetical protein
MRGSILSKSPLCRLAGEQPDANMTWNHFLVPHVGKASNTTKLLMDVSLEFEHVRFPYEH